MTEKFCAFEGDATNVDCSAHARAACSAVSCAAPRGAPPRLKRTVMGAQVMVARSVTHSNCEQFDAAAVWHDGHCIGSWHVVTCCAGSGEDGRAGGRRINGRSVGRRSTSMMGPSTQCTHSPTNSGWQFNILFWNERCPENWNEKWERDHFLKGYTMYEL